MLMMLAPDVNKEHSFDKSILDAKGSIGNGGPEGFHSTAKELNFLPLRPA